MLQLMLQLMLQAILKLKCVLHLMAVTQNLTAAGLLLAPGMSKRSKHVPMRYAPGLGILAAHSFNRATILATLEYLTGMVVASGPINLTLAATNQLASMKLQRLQQCARNLVVVLQAILQLMHRATQVGTTWLK